MSQPLPASETSGSVLAPGTLPNISPATPLDKDQQEKQDAQAPEKTLEEMKSAMDLAKAERDAMAVNLFRYQQQAEQKEQESLHLQQTLQSTKLASDQRAEEQEQNLAVLRDENQRLTTALINKVDVNMIQQHQAEVEQKLGVHQQCAEHFKQTSERLSAELKRTNRANEALKREMAVMQAQLDAGMRQQKGGLPSISPRY